MNSNDLEGFYQFYPPARLLTFDEAKCRFKSGAAMCSRWSVNTLNRANDLLPTWQAACRWHDEAGKPGAEVWENMIGEWRVVMPNTLNDLHEPFETKEEALLWVKENGYRRVAGAGDAE